MAFDWMAFAEGFMETAATNIKEKKREAREYETEQEDLAKRNVLKISQRNATVNKIMGVATMLKDNGVSNEQIQAAIASGPNAIVELSTKVQEAVAAGGGKPLTSADVDSIIRMPKDFSPVDMELDEYVKRSYGLYSPNVGVGEEAEVGFWDRVSGDAAMKRTKAKLDSSAMYEGMTAADINELAALSDYQAVIPSTFATFSDFKRFDNKARVSVQADLITQIEALEEMDSEYAAARAVIKDISPTTQIAEEIEQRNNALEVIQRKNRENFGPIFDQAITTYGTQALTGLEDLMTTYMGEEYVTDLRDTLSPAIKEEVEVNTKAEVDEATNTVTMSDSSIISTPDGQAVDVTFELDTDGMVVAATADGIRFEGEDAQLMYTEFNTVDTQETPDQPAVEAQPEIAPTIEVDESKRGSRKERRDSLGLGAKPVEEEPAAPVKSLREKTMERMGISEETIQEGMDTGQITELDLQILNEEADDILKYIEGKVEGKPTQMQLYSLLSDWADENNKRLPYNMNFLIKGFQRVLNDG
jgi:hypothetical protein